MRAIVCTGTGGPEVLEWTEVPNPVPAPGEVLIAVSATAVNRADLLQRQGKYPPPPGASPILGLECAGTIVALGAGVHGPRVGDEVTALLAGGGYAELVSVPSGQLMTVPAPLGLLEAAALPEAACTVWSNLDMVARLQPGEWVLIHGGGSGIGTTAIQLARAMGARVAVTAGSAAKLDTCERLGAEVLIDYRTQDFVAEITRVTMGAGADVILDIMGAEYLARNCQALARNGRLVIIGLQGGATGELGLGPLLAKNGSIHPTSLRGRPVAEKTTICRAVEHHVWPWVHAGIVTPVIGATMPLAQAATAHRMLAAGEVTGKVLLTVP